MNRTPRVSVGLPVYNGSNYLSEALDALLGQSFEDFELIVSDNASTDDTEEICRDYAARDPRIRYHRQPQNIGAVPNHNFTVVQARGEFFKWTSHDDLYGRDLLLRCVEALDEHPDVVLSHAWYSVVDGSSSVAATMPYPLATDSPYAPERFRSLLFGVGGEDFYGVVRTDVFRRIPMHDSYHPIAERPMLAGLSLFGRFHQVPEYLAFRRFHGERAGGKRSKREQCAIMDPRRANRYLHPTLRLHAEYIWGFASAINRAPISFADKRQCYRDLAAYVTSRARPEAFMDTACLPPPVGEHITVDLAAVVPGQRKKVS